MTGADPLTARIFVPGRIEVLGKHTDYAGGSSLLIAIERGFTFEAWPLAEDRITIAVDQPVAAGTHDRLVGSDRSAGSAPDTTEPGAGSERAPREPARIGYAIRRTGDVVTAVPEDASDHPTWARYVDGVLQRVLCDFGEAARGARLRFRSDLPVAAGLSSSSALVCGTFLALDAICRFSALPAFRRTLSDRSALAGWLSAAEMGGPVGTRGGSEDHVAILCGEAGRIVRYRLAPIRYRGAVPIPDGWTFAVAASGVVADKGGEVQAHYNRLSDLAATSVRAWTLGTGIDAVNLGDALDRAGSADAVVAGIRAGLASDPRLRTVGVTPDKGPGSAVVPLIQRARHFLEENALVDDAFDALERGDVDAFAAAANRSAAVGAELLENQVPETLHLAKLAHALGAPAASPFGGGFGGAVWALVRQAEAPRFLEQWRERYRADFPGRDSAKFFTTGAGGPARLLHGGQ